MTTNPWIETSRKLYAALLTLYPHEHRAEFGEPMRQVFTDQCRNVYAQKGILGIFLLWLRTLPDLGYTALLEHVTSPRAAWGLMEPVPNAPLPWKGVFLILLPGLVYLAGQVAQLITGETWFYFVTYRVTFFLILPPIIAWVITRRFPLWGLIPLGLFFRVTQEIGYQFIVYHPRLFWGNPILLFILDTARRIEKNLWLLIIPLAIATLLLGWWYVRQQRPPRSFWVWLGVYALVACARIVGLEYAAFIPTLQQALSRPQIPETIKWLSAYTSWALYPVIALLFLIFLGVFFTRRHGFFAILILVGYVLPTTLVGPQNFSVYPNPAFALAIFSTAILAYRATLTLVAPIWMSRTASQTRKKRIVLACIAIALTIHALAQFLHPAMLYPAHPNMQVTPNSILYVAIEELQLISAFLLAITMYQNVQPKMSAPEAAPLQAAEFSARQA